MKKTIIIILALLISPNLYSNWEKITNMPDQFLNSYWLDVYFLESDPNYGWTCGYGGRIIRTTDAGESWQGVVIQGADQLESVHFASPLVGYTSGEGKIYRSVDGGATWRNVTPQGADILLWGNFFISEDEGYVIGGTCDGLQRFFRTTDGGTTWNHFAAFFPNTKLSDAMMQKETGIGYASSSGLIWKSTDYGVTWAVHSQTGGMDWQEEITNFGRSFLVPYSIGCDGNTNLTGGMRFSTDYGATWRDYSTPASMYGTFLLDSLRGWACGINQLVYYTEDGGVTWELINCGIDPGAALDDVWFVNDTIGWLAGQGLYKYKRNSIPEPIITILGDTEICPGDSVTIVLEGTYNFHIWSNGATTQSITVGEAGTYSVFVRESECEYAYSTDVDVIVRTPEEIAIEYSSTEPLCFGDTVFLKIVSPYSSFIWSDGSIEEIIEVTEPGAISIFVTDIYGCNDSLEIDIVFYELPEPRINPLTRINVCVGDSVLLEVVPTYSNVEWYRDDVLLANRGSFLLVGTGGNYYAEVRDNNNCFGITEPIEVTVRNETNRLMLEISESSDEFFIDSTNYPLMDCRPLTIKNVSENEMTIYNPLLFYNLSFSIPKSQFPMNLQAGEEKQINICYSPRSLKYERDTLIIEDICNDHYLPLLAYGDANTYIDNTKCDVDLMLKSIDLTTGTYFINASPYPNPAANNANLSLAIFRKHGDLQELSAELYDILGNRLSSEKVDVYASQKLDSGIIETGEIHFDTSMLSRGIYIIKLQLGRQTQIVRLAVE